MRTAVAMELTTALTFLVGMKPLSERDENLLYGILISS